MLPNSKMNPDKVGWRVNEWADDVGLGRAYTYELIKEGRIKSVNTGRARIITTPPTEFLRQLAERNGDEL
jgi:excisionase family DNA binding protein